ncbi:MAG: tRNA (adenosine(37)-N6)-threonylcarbamoyltransferase complex dimerization subunit type 1 TsaB [Parvularculaceae bacterium]|nr:tRNA (adenosine(37)-N6)-threonylcarbamoyltransferase complex dimerization subunit type 1 TsaB [Parvularculaceae bacterium]
MRVIAFDTTGAACSLAITDSGSTLWSRTISLSCGHAEELPKMALEALRDTSLAAADFDRIGVTTGPGTFAGVRVGIAFARGLALGSSARLIGVSTLKALAAGRAQEDAITAPIIDARRGQVYAALYSCAGVELLNPFVDDLAAARAKIEQTMGRAPYKAIGPGAHLFEGTASQTQQASITEYPDPAVIARLAQSSDPDENPPAPLYLRAPDARPQTHRGFAANE